MGAGAGADAAVAVGAGVGWVCGWGAGGLCIIVVTCPARWALVLVPLLQLGVHHLGCLWGGGVGGLGLGSLQQHGGLSGQVGGLGWQGVPDCQGPPLIDPHLPSGHPPPSPPPAPPAAGLSGCPTAGAWSTTPWPTSTEPTSHTWQACLLIWHDWTGLSADLAGPVDLACLLTCRACRSGLSDDQAC